MGKKATAEPVRMILGTKLRSLRVQHALTQAEVAEHVGNRQSAISAWERDQSCPNSGQQKKLAELFEVPFHEIAVLAADYDERFAQGNTNRRPDDRPNHHRK